MTMANRKALSDFTQDEILAAIVDPEHNPLPEKYDAELHRVMQASRLWDRYPNERHVADMMIAKYGISRTMAMKDLALAKRLYNQENRIDYDAMATWAVKDQLELINKLKLRRDFKEWNKAKKVLMDMLERIRPAQEEDPRRMEKNTFVVNVNTGMGKSFAIPLDMLRSLGGEALKTMIDSMTTPIEDAQVVEEIWDS